MYAVIKTGGKQYPVEPGDVLSVEKLKVEPGQKIEFDQVLYLNDDKSVRVGAPYLDDVLVSGTVLENGKAKKVITFKFKAKKDYRKKQGHRQPYSKVEIDAFIAGGVEIAVKPEFLNAAADITPMPGGEESAADETAENSIAADAGETGGAGETAAAAAAVAEDGGAETAGGTGETGGAGGDQPEEKAEAAPKAKIKAEKAGKPAVKRAAKPKAADAAEKPAAKKETARSAEKKRAAEKAADMEAAPENEAAAGAAADIAEETPEGGVARDGGTSAKEGVSDGE
jgi:large subunit ribosomal protein L21